MDFETIRRNMIECQIRTNKVTDPAILEAMAALPRERFVPKARQAMAYVDDDVPCGSGRSLMVPMVLARMIQEAGLGPNDAVLCIGAGTGYSVAVMAKIARVVFALESVPELARQAGELLAELNLDNAVVVEGPLQDGWPDESPYDVILFDGAVPEVPSAVLGQLAEGGRLVAVIEGDEAIGRVTLFARVGESISRRRISEAVINRLPEFNKAQEFVF